MRIWPRGRASRTAYKFDGEVRRERKTRFFDVKSDLVVVELTRQGDGGIPTEVALPVNPPKSLVELFKGGGFTATNGPVGTKEMLMYNLTTKYKSLRISR